MKTFEEDNYLFTYLEKDIEEAKKDIKQGKGLTQKGAMAMLLKGMYNHIAHLNENMVTKQEFNDENMLTRKEFNMKFDVLQSQFGFVKWLITFGFILLAALMMILAFVN